MSKILSQHKVALKITRPRVTKLGDYRPPQNGHPHRVSINNNLNKYAFLITLLHEIAHMKNWEKHEDKVKPHGQEWKTIFRELILPFIGLNIFPDDVMRTLANYMKNPAAASCTDTVLLKALKKHDQQINPYLEEFPEKTIFKLANAKNGKRVFQKGEKLRKRYKCVEVNSKRTYLVSAVAEVEAIQ
ncbi:MAG: sprT domain-containing protein [Flavobacteriales bacterium]|nr:MAG: sprT domain-containing protein [Flavobacteriales bacterium]